MLNERQKKIIGDLETTTILITAKMLADKYKVSLRTIRNDINEIASYVKQQKEQFIRIPGQGMRINSSRPLTERFLQVFLNREFLYLSEEERSLLLLLQFIFKKNPISIEALCETFSVSRGTIIATIKQINDGLLGDIQLKGYKNRGYYLELKPEEFLKLNEVLINTFGSEMLSKTLMQEENELITSEDKERLNQTVSYISNHLLLFISHYYRLVYLLYALLCGFKQSLPYVRQLELEESKLQQLIQYIALEFNIQLNYEWAMLIRHVLVSTTDYLDNMSEEESDQKLLDAIDASIQFVSNSGMYQINDKENLRIDLLIHLKSAVAARNVGVPKENPLLEEIKASYPNEFQLVKSSMKVFNKVYNLKLDDSEIGYMTLYFLRSFEKSGKIQEARVMVVCNTGRSASKLLATRLMNNLPNIHIVSMDSIYNVQNNEEILDNIDFVISTIELPDIAKPHIVISPLLQESELERVREAIWLSQRQDVQVSGSLNKVADSIAHSYMKHRQLSRMEQNRMVGFVPEELNVLLGEISMEIFQLVANLYPKGIKEKNYNNVSGIFAHILMSVPRWQRGEYIVPNDYDDLEHKYAKEYAIIRQFLDTVSKKIGNFIDSAEVIAILRYYIY